MLKKVSLVLSVLAVLGFAVAISAPADAKPQQQGKTVNKTTQFKQSNKNVNIKQNIKVKNFQSNKSIKVKNFQSNKNVNFKSGKFKVGQKVNGHMWFGHSRHRWHGRWYAYGEGECWINIEGEWFWNELVCPF
jgi:hypothetical protein